MLYEIERQKEQEEAQARREQEEKRIRYLEKQRTKLE